MFKPLLVLLILSVSLGCEKDRTLGLANTEKFSLGNEMLIEKNLNLLKNKHVALVTNQTGILSNGTHIIDTLVSLGISPVKIFSPEHGIRGDENYSDTDEKTGIRVISIYGEKTRPSNSDLTDVDVVIYDIQDVGARFYTYTSTLYSLIEAIIENKKELIVCDRPVIINPDYVDGFMLERGFESFVGKIPAPVCYGMTCGELALMLSGSSNIISVIKMEGYSHQTDYESLKLKWVKPSPNIFTSGSALCYPAECFLEGTNISEGRGTDKPFEYCGAPWIDGDKLAAELNSIGLEGVNFETAEFIPSEKISAYPPKFFNQQCYGIKIFVKDKKLFEPVKCGVAIIYALHKISDKFEFTNKNFIDKLAGTNLLRKSILNGNSYNEIISLWDYDVQSFLEKRKKYLLYN
jgi:uncharacterized protein YbbC (DUF1343 family)